MKTSTSKPELLDLSRNAVQWSLQVGRASLKQVEKSKYLVVAFTSDGRQDEKLLGRSGKANAVIRTFRCLTNLVTMRFENLSTSSRYFSGSKDLNQLRWFGHVSKMPQQRLHKQTLYAAANGKRSVGQRLTRWLDYIEDLG